MFSGDWPVSPAARREPHRGDSAHSPPAWLLLLAIGVFLAFVTKTGGAYSRAWVGLWFAAGFLAQTAMRVALRVSLRFCAAAATTCVTFTSSARATSAARSRCACAARRGAGSPCADFSTTRPSVRGTSVEGIPVLGTIDTLYSRLEQGGIDQVGSHFRCAPEESIHRLVLELRGHRRQVRYVPDIFGFQLLRHSFSEVAGMPVIGLADTPLQGFQRVLKALEDYLLSGVAVMVAAPLLLAIALAIKLTSPGPVLYRQERVTWNGRRFNHAQVPLDACRFRAGQWAGVVAAS